MSGTKNNIKSMKGRPGVNTELNTWQMVADECPKHGFQKTTIIRNDNYQTVGKTAPTDIATAWMDGTTQINENQEILDLKLEVEGKARVKKQEMRFYGQVFHILSRNHRFDQRIPGFRKSELSRSMRD